MSTETGKRPEQFINETLTRSGLHLIDSCTFGFRSGIEVHVVRCFEGVDVETESPLCLVTTFKGLDMIDAKCVQAAFYGFRNAKKHFDIVTSTGCVNINITDGSMLVIEKEK